MPAEIEFPNIPLHAVLSTAELAAILDVNERSILRSDFPWFYVVPNGRERRYSWRQVLAHLEQRAKNTASNEPPGVQEPAA